MSTANERAGLLAGGNWIVDHVKVIDSWPPQDTLADIVAESWGNGGSPYNILKDLARLGAPFPLAGVGLIGDDADGGRILEDCRHHQIDTTQLQRTKLAPTAYSDVMTDRTTGRRTFFHQRGANALLAPEHFDFAATRARIFHLGYLLLLDGLDRPDAADGGRPRTVDVLRRARAAGLMTSVDCVSENSDRFGALVKPVLPEVDLLFVNDFEAEKITGVALRGSPGGPVRRDAVERAAAELLALGVRRWVVLHFPEAVYAVERGGGAHWQPSVRVPAAMIKGTAGAGDALASGVLYGLHEKAEVADALRLGVCAAACSLFEADCSSGLRPASDCGELATALGLRSLCD
ncbi:MAG TPA: carbohydrate kinase family protein [Opitutaceae bacterium]